MSDQEIPEDAQRPPGTDPQEDAARDVTQSKEVQR